MTVITVKHPWGSVSKRHDEVDDLGFCALMLLQLNVDQRFGFDKMEVVLCDGDAQQMTTAAQRIVTELMSMSFRVSATPIHYGYDLMGWTVEVKPIAGNWTPLQNATLCRV